MKVGQIITQDDINLKIFKELDKLDTKINWSIGLQLTVSVATIVIMVSIASYTIHLIEKVIK
ncbi:MAG: hypothetical protein DRP93_06080 [Candidatus Neomarinimicrobiota bacterium]|nr:MAG: hypothetical protein DRP93_06080 [Candidatus Neomarinimicrobiota bacterium]